MVGDPLRAYAIDSSDCVGGPAIGGWGAGDFNKGLFSIKGKNTTFPEIFRRLRRAIEPKPLYLCVSD